MELEIRTVGPDPVDDVVDYVARRQAAPASHVVFVGEGAATVGADLADVARWRDRLLVARADGAVVGAVLTDIDEARRRAWWFGPWADGPDIAAALVAAADARFGAAWDEEEFAPDVANRLVAELAVARGCTPGTASSVLAFDAAQQPTPRPSGRTAPLDATSAPAVAALHDRLFPATHTLGADLVRADKTTIRAAMVDGVVAGYVAVEVLADGVGYIDYLGVEPGRRRLGLGRALVGDAVASLVAAGVTETHLTVREDAVGARDLYRSLGFVELRVIRPYRRGFDLG